MPDIECERKCVCRKDGSFGKYGSHRGSRRFVLPAPLNNKRLEKHTTKMQSEPLFLFPEAVKERDDVSRRGTFEMTEQEIRTVSATGFMLFLPPERIQLP